MIAICCYAEVRRDGAWHFDGEMIENPACQYDPTAPSRVPEPLFESCNRELAAILIDYGNPIRSVEPYVPVVPPRGLPSDLSIPLQTYFGYYKDDDGGLVFTWFTGKELLDFNLDSREMKRRAFVDPKVAHLFRECPRGFPYDRWPTELPITFADWSRDDVEVSWVETYSEIVKGFADAVPATMMKSGSLDDVRLVVEASW